MKNKFQLPNKLRGRNIHIKVIPTVCTLKNMLNKLVSVGGDCSQLKQWEKRSYKAYRIDEIKNELLQSADYSNWPGIIKKHILAQEPSVLGANCIDIYLVAYVAETYGAGKNTFIKYVMESGISDKYDSANAVWQVGRGDGVYLGILNNDGTVLDWDFISKWVNGC